MKIKPFHFPSSFSVFGISLSPVFFFLHVLRFLHLRLLASVCTTVLICNEPVKDNGVKCP